jgi:hypothetical protein
MITDNKQFGKYTPIVKQLMQETMILRRKIRSRYYHTHSRFIEPTKLITFLLLVFSAEQRYT